jgi:hypothetical protein
MATNRRDNLRPISETARFFGKSIEWIRFHETSGNFKYENGDRIEPIRAISPRGHLSTRMYDLDMIEQMALSLKREYKISKYQCERILNIVKAFRMVESEYRDLRLQRRRESTDN